MLSPNNVLLSKIAAQVLKGSWLCPRRTDQRTPNDEKMTEYQGLTAQLEVMYTVCAHQGRSHRCLSKNPADSWRAWINWAGTQGHLSLREVDHQREAQGAQGSNPGTFRRVIYESLLGHRRCAHTAAVAGNRVSWSLWIKKSDLLWSTLVIRIYMQT